MLAFYIYSYCTFIENEPSIWGNAVSVGEGIVFAGGLPPKNSCREATKRGHPGCSIGFTTGVSIS